MVCAKCGTRIPDGLGVTLGRRHGFCDEQCRDRWAVARVLFLEGEVKVVHFSRFDQRLAWQITHRPSGMAVSCSEMVGINKADVLKIARHLSRQTFATSPPDPAFGAAVYACILAALGVAVSA